MSDVVTLALAIDSVAEEFSRLLAAKGYAPLVWNYRGGEYQIIIGNMPLGTTIFLHLPVQTPIDTIRRWLVALPPPMPQGVIMPPALPDESP